MDLSAGMVQLGADKAKLLGPHVTAEVAKLNLRAHSLNLRAARC